MFIAVIIVSEFKNKEPVKYFEKQLLASRNQFFFFFFKGLKGGALVVEHLPSMQKVLGLIFNTELSQTHTHIHTQNLLWPLQYDVSKMTRNLNKTSSSMKVVSYIHCYFCHF